MRMPLGLKNAPTHSNVWSIRTARRPRKNRVRVCRRHQHLCSRSRSARWRICLNREYFHKRVTAIQSEEMPSLQNWNTLSSMAEHRFHGLPVGRSTFRISVRTKVQLNQAPMTQKTLAKTRYHQLNMNFVGENQTCPDQPQISLKPETISF